MILAGVLFAASFLLVQVSMGVAHRRIALAVVVLGLAVLVGLTGAGILALGTEPPAP